MKIKSSLSNDINELKGVTVVRSSRIAKLMNSRE